MKPVFQIAAAAAFLALGACSTAIDVGPATGLGGPAVTAAAATLPGDVPQFAANSVALAGVLAEGNAMRVTYVRRGSAPVIGGAVSGTCPYAQALSTGVYTAAAGPLRPLEAGRTYRFTNY